MYPLLSTPTKLRSWFGPWSGLTVLFFGAIAAVLFLRMQVIWPIGFHQDSAIAANWLAGADRDGESLYGFCHRFSKKLVNTQGRFIPVTIYICAPLQIALGENLVALRCLQMAAHLAAFVAFAAFVRRLSGDQWLAGVIVVVYAAIYEIRDYIDPAFGVGILLPTLIFFGSVSCCCALRCADEPSATWNRDWWLAALFSLLNILTWELALPFCFLASCLLLLGQAPWRVRWLRAIGAGMAPLALTAISLWLKRHATYSGTTLGSLDPAVIWATFSEQAVSAMPLSYQYFDPQRVFPAGWTSDSDYFSAVAIGVLTAVATGIGLHQCRAIRIRAVLFCGGILLVAPPLMIAVSARYQVDSAFGLGYTQTAMTYGGVSVLAVMSLHLLRNVVGAQSRVLGGSLLLLAAIGIGLVAGRTLIGSAWVADLTNQRWRNPREMFATWLHETRASLGSPGLFVVEHPWLYRWENPNFLFEHLRFPSAIMTRRDFDLSGSRVPEGSVLVDLSFTKRVQRSGRFVIVSVVSDGAPTRRTRRLSAYVISADRYSLAGVPFCLEKGNDAWALPEEIFTGYGGYLFRKVEIETDSPWVDGCRVVGD